MNKKALEVSINFIAMLILAVVIFAFAITLTYRFWGKAEEMKTNIDSQTEAQIEAALMETGARVALPLNSKTVFRGEHAVYGLGILNVEGEKKNFDVKVKGAEQEDDDYLEFLIGTSRPISIKNNERQKVGIAIRVKEGAPKDTYIANVCVCINTCDDCPPQTSVLYGNALNKIYVKVP